jgi:hypothetical protein
LQHNSCTATLVASLLPLLLLLLLLSSSVTRSVGHGLT